MQFTFWSELYSTFKGWLINTCLFFGVYDWTDYSKVGYTCTVYVMNSFNIILVIVHLRLHKPLHITYNAGHTWWKILLHYNMITGRLENRSCSGSYTTVSDFLLQRNDLAVLGQRILKELVCCSHWKPFTPSRWWSSTAPTYRNKQKVVHRGWTTFCLLQ